MQSWRQEERRTSMCSQWTGGTWSLKRRGKDRRCRRSTGTERHMRHMSVCPPFTGQARTGSRHSTGTVLGYGSTGTLLALRVDARQ